MPPPAAGSSSRLNCVGGVLKDMDESMLKNIVDTVNDMEKELRPIAEAFLRDYTVGTRLHGLGVLSAENAQMLGAVGPMARASGVACDIRKLGYGAYGELEFAPITSAEGGLLCPVRCPNPERSSSPSI